MPRWKDAAFSARSADLYEGIADTFVQLFASRSAGLIASYSRQVSKKSDMAKNKTGVVTGAQQGIGAGLVDGFVDAVLYLADASEVTGEVLHVDGGAQIDVGSFRNSK